ncbi:ATP-binding protein [Paracoccus sp. IB05]|uniref:ATP-binding protein n=1 Tax=Paracoccus sp. IB05 TaxID=2779367 RepID=UPI0018E740B3|nr:ATP-binding protein [Paracoccus sp. IB05]MBJ2149550.1 ATP-binding protein [Paracoccus sp. IB05]
MSIFRTLALLRTGPKRRILVSRDGNLLTASVALPGGGWLLTPVPDPAPSEGRWLILDIWIAMIVVGSVAVSWYAACRLSRPIGLMEEAALEMGGIGLQMILAGMMPVMVSAGPLALKRALRNLMTNAATHGGGGTVSLGPEGAMTVATIQHHGPGIPESLIDRVFEPFFRVDPGRQKVQPGAGPGLAIAFEILSRFGGAIAIRNRMGGGMEQEITLPILTA